MKTLEAEANEYAKNDDTRSYDFCNQTLVDAFESGANSKWVRAEKIKAQIEILNKLQVHFQDGIGFEVFESYMEPLQQKLKEIENENT